jgi:hypothetical protein
VGGIIEEMDMIDDNFCVSLASTPNPVYCDSCGRCLTLKSGGELTASLWAIKPSNENLAAEAAEIYPEIELGREYRICWACQLRNQGVNLLNRTASED